MQFKKSPKGILYTLSLNAIYKHEVYFSTSIKFTILNNNNNNKNNFIITIIKLNSRNNRALFNFSL